MQAARIVAQLLIFGLATGCASLNAYRLDLERTWEKAEIFLPQADFPGYTSRPAIVPALAYPLPTVLYLHGCTGITPDDRRWARTLAAAGYAVAMPNSFAREYRPMNCNADTKMSGWNPQVAVQVHEMRQEEIGYALSKFRVAAWVDRENVFLMGHSEGGFAVARWRGGEFRGHIISAWTCTDRSSRQHDGIWAPVSIPILAIAPKHDPWYRGTWMEGSCEAKFGGRKDARQITLSGSDHSTVNSAVAREAVLQFLLEHAASKPQAVSR